MLFGLIRLFITLVCATALVLLLKRKHVQFNLKRIIYLCIGATVFFFVLVFFVPFENIFTSFSSPEAIWRYMWEKDDYITYINGDDSTLFIYEKQNGKTSCDLFVKTENGWKLGIAFDKILFLPFKTLNCSITLCKQQQSKECFVLVREIILVGQDTPQKISDNIGSEFIKLEELCTDDQYVEVNTYYAIVPAQTEKYELSFGEDTIVLNVS